MSTSVCFAGLPQEWKKGTELLLPQLGLEIAESGKTVRVLRGEGLSVCEENGAYVICADRANDYFRALSHLPSVMKSGVAVKEKSVATTLCVMEDMSRNSVMNMASLQRLLRTLALMGYDSVMLYTEDTYELPGYPYFGHMRGRYTLQELKEIDDYAFDLGIEVIPCVQTLGHMGRVLQWRAFGGIKDTDTVMLADSEPTYEFIDHILKTMRSVFRSKRINIGMDEAHDLGRGAYLDKNGFVPAHEIMLRHLDRVVDLCKKNGYETPMMWSDMFFRMAFNGQYYIEEGEIPPEVAAKISRDVTLVYWDYYAKTREQFSHMVKCHTKLEGVPTAFAGGAWCWSGFAPANRFSLKYTEMQLEECFHYGITDIIATAWGDNGGECSRFAILPTLLYYAEHSYNGKAPSAAQLEARARALLGIGFEEMLTLDAPNQMPEVTEVCITNPCKYLLFNDPLLGMLDAHLVPETAPAAFAAAKEKLTKFEDHPTLGYVFKTLAALSQVLIRKGNLSARLHSAYRTKDEATLQEIADEIPAIIADLDAFYVAFRDQWYRESKPFGFEVQEQRIGGLRLRLEAARERLLAYLSGEVEDLPELTVDPLPYRLDVKPERGPYIGHNNWRTNVSTSIV